MSWLYDWLREIILIIMLATFVEMLLPNNKLQRYVKVVISLVILLTILQPVVRFLLSGSELETFTTALTKTEVERGQGEMTGLDPIMQSAEQMQKEQEQQTIAMVQREIEEQTRKGLQEELDQEVLEVHAELKLDSNKELSLQRLEVILSEQHSQGAKKEEGTPKKIEIQPVEPVDIDISVGETPSASNTEPPVDEQHEEMVTETVKWIEKHWNMDSKQIHVSVLSDNVDYRS